MDDVSDAFNIAMDKIERGIVPSVKELLAANLCRKCTGFGFLTFDDDTEKTCDRCDGSGRHED